MVLKFKIFTLFVLFLAAGYYKSDAQSFYKAFDDSSAIGVYGVAESSDGGYFFYGKNSSYLYPSAWGLFGKMDSLGTVEWQHYITGQVGVWYAKETSLKGHYLYCTDSLFEPMIIKTDSSGNIIWQRHYDFLTPYYNEPEGMILLKDDGLIFLYEFWSAINNNMEQVAVIRIDSAGNIVWSKQFCSGPQHGDYATDIDLSPDSNIYVLGYQTYNLQSMGSTLTRLDLNGNFIYTRRFNRDYEHLIIRSENEFFLGGIEKNPGAVYDIALLRIDSSLNILNSYYYTLPHNSITPQWFAEGNSTIEVVGMAYNYISSTHNMFAFTINDSGQVIRSFKFQDPDLTPFSITGAERTQGVYSVIKNNGSNSLSGIICNKDGLICNQDTILIRDTTHTFVVDGYLTLSPEPFTPTIRTPNHSIVTSISAIDGCSLWNGVSSLQTEDVVSIFPNPFNDLIKLNSINAGQFSIYDMFGKLLMRWNVNPGVNTFNTSGFCSGMYVYVMNGGGIYRSGKIIKM